MWTISAEAMSPLITAYDCKILELQDALKSQTAQLEVLNDHCQEIVAENEKLRDNQLENLKNSSKDRRAAGAASGLEPFAPINSEMMAEMNERLDILMSENALLLEQKNLLRGELEKYQGDLAKRTAEMQDISSKHKAYGKEMKNLKDLLEQTEGDRDDIGAKLLRQGETMGKMEAERESLMDDYVHIQKSNKKAEKTIEDLSKQMKGLVMKSDEESVAYMRRTKTAETRVRELHIQLQKTTAELHTSQDNSRKLRREYQATRADAEGMLQVLSGLERQIADFTSRESDFEKRMKENREALEVALAAKDQALAREEHSRREIERLLIERKKTALDRQKDVDQATELSLGRSQVYIKTVEKNLEELTLTNTQLKADTELALKENRGDKANIENYSKLLDEQRRATFDDIKQLSDKLTAVTVAKEEELRRRIEVQEFNKEMRTTIDKMRSQMEHTTMQADSKEKTLNTEISSLKIRLKENTRQLNEKNRQLLRKHSELEEMKIDFDERIVSLERRRQDDVTTLQKTNVELEATVREIAHNQSADANESKNLIAQIKEKNVTAMKYLEQRLLEERDNVEDLIEKKRVLEDSIFESQEERTQLVHLVEDARSTIRDLQGKLDEAQSTITDLMNNVGTSNMGVSKYSAISGSKTLTNVSTAKINDFKRQSKVPMTDSDFGIVSESRAREFDAKVASILMEDDDDDDYVDEDIDEDINNVL